MDSYSDRLKISISWSGGKDSSLMLQRILLDSKYKIVELHTLLNEDTQRVGLHGIHKDLITAQSLSIGLPIKFIYSKSSSTNDSYEQTMSTYYADCLSRNITHIAFGDIFLEDLKSYRDKLLFKSGLLGVYPLWKNDTTILSRQFVSSGFKAIICSSDPQKFTSTAAGSELDEVFLNTLPKHIDPCGENGEFHSFVFDGSIFNKRLNVKIGDIEKHDYEFDNEEGVKSKASFDFVELKLYS